MFRNKSIKLYYTPTVQQAFYDIPHKPTARIRSVRAVISVWIFQYRAFDIPSVLNFISCTGNLHYRFQYSRL